LTLKYVSDRLTLNDCNTIPLYSA